MRHTLRLALLLTFALVSAPQGRSYGAIVSVETSRGQRLTGDIDARSDEHRLWVRQQRGGIVMTTSVAWDDVTAARVGGQSVNAAEVRERRHELMSAAAELPAAQAAAAPSVAQAVYAEPVRHVRSLEILSACLKNLDRDVEPDGIAVAISAVDDAGKPVAVRGHITARLYGELRPESIRDVAFGKLDEWTRPIATSDFASGVATFDLQFRRTAPEWQFDLLPDAVIEISLLAYGEGHFSASEPVVVRAFNPLRDNQQLLLKSRFFPGEHRGPPPGAMPPGQDGRWLHWTW